MIKIKINVDFKFKDLEKFYVEQINIFGNFITEEKVIRNSLIVDEGDAYNQILFNKSINNIKSRGIFKSVKSNIKIQKMKIIKKKLLILQLKKDQLVKYLLVQEQELQVQQLQLV